MKRYVAPKTTLIFKRLAKKLQTARAIADLEMRSWKLIRMAREFECMTPSQPEQAAELYQKVLTLAQGMPNNKSRSGILLNLAKEFMYNQPEQAFELWKLVISDAQAIADENQRANVLSLVVETATDATNSLLNLVDQTATDDTDSVYEWDRFCNEESFTPVLQVVHALENTEHRHDLLYKIACLFDRTGQTDQALDLVKQNSVVPPDYMSYFEHCENLLWKVLPGFEEKPLAYYNPQREGILEAYRFIYAPSFDPALIIRVWSTPTSYPYFYAAAKLGRTRRLAEESWMLSANSELSFLEAVRASQFWHSKIWKLTSSVYDDDWVFEGWREGQYHCLYARNPDNGPAYRLGQAFFDLLPQVFFDLLPQDFEPSEI